MGRDDPRFEDLTQTRYQKLLERLDRSVEREELLDQLRMEADTCPITGLLNRRGLDRRVRTRTWGWYVAIDLDGFKRAQDAHPEGHAYGDRVLIAFADFLLANTRQGEMRVRDTLICRQGGDEFLVWAETRAGARRIRDVVRGWRMHDISASAGIGDSPEAADAAMYLDKTGPTEVNLDAPENPSSPVVGVDPVPPVDARGLPRGAGDHRVED